MSEEKLKEQFEFMDVYDDEDDSMANKYMTFIVGEESFGIAIEYILEIIELQKVTTVPDMPEYVKGVINLRGKIIPVIDLRLRLKLIEKKYDDRTCIIVTQIQDTAVGFIVDTVQEVVNINESHISPPPDFQKTNNKDKYIKGLGKVGDQVKIILDVEKLLYEKDLDSLRNIKNSMSFNEQKNTDGGKK